MSVSKKKGTQREITEEEKFEEKESRNLEKYDEWKRLEKWRPGRRNFS